MWERLGEREKVQILNSIISAQLCAAITLSARALPAPCARDLEMKSVCAPPSLKCLHVMTSQSTRSNLPLRDMAFLSNT